MRRKILLVILLIQFFNSLHAQTLGTYNSTTINAGRNKTVTPNSSPNNTSKITVSTNSNFQGILTGDPVSGKVTIVAARPAGEYLIKVKAFSASGTSVTKTFILTVSNPKCSDGVLNYSSKTNTGPNQLGVLIGDFNKDGRQDIAGVHEGGNNTLSIRMGNGNGTFTGTTEYPVGSHPFHGAIGDFNGDGNQDICVANSGGGHTSILLGNGTGGFVTNPVVVCGTTPICAAVGDFNSDGKQDLAVANLNGHNVSIRLGDGAGYFSGSTQVSVGRNPYYVVVGDFNGDGKQDLATCGGAVNTISIRLGNGSGGFSGNTEIPVGSHPFCLAVGDFNQDGKQDLAASNYATNTVSIRMGNGQGGFSGNTEIPVGVNPNFVAVGNFNGDDHLDIATANYLSNNVSLRFGKGNGLFVGNTQFNAGSYPTSLAVGDFNSDNLMDVAVSNYNDRNITIHMGVDGNHIMPAATNDGPVCAGNPVNLSAPAGISYTWSGPNGFQSTAQNINIQAAYLSDTGEYVVTLTDTAGCTGSTSTVLVVNHLPEVTFSLMDDSMCVDHQSKPLIDGTPTGGTFSGIGVIGHSFIPHISGPGVFTISYSYTDSNNCTNIAKDRMYVDLCMGINDAITLNNFEIFPNPFRDYFQLQLPLNTVLDELTLYSIEGQIVKTWKVSGKNDLQFPTEELNAGIYFLKLFSQNKVSILRVVKQ